MKSEQIYEKHCAISLVEILGIGTGRRDLKTTILSAINEALEVGATKEAELQQRIKELENEQKIYKAIKITFDEKLLIEELEEKRKTNTELFIHATKWKKRACELESQQGKFAEWVYHAGYRPSILKGGMWYHYKEAIDGEGWACDDISYKTTSELWAEWDRCGSI